MESRLLRLGRLGAKAGTLALSGALASAMMVPAAALAHYEYDNASGKVLADTLDGGVQRVDNTDDDHVYQYMGYVHSDGNHYSPYSLFTEITTDADGIVTALDLTSDNSMWTGKWGYMTEAIEGYLPDGVDFKADQNSDGTWSPRLSGTSAYDIAGPAVTFMSVNADGTADALGIDQSAGGKRTASASGGGGGKSGGGGGKGGGTPAAVPAYTSNSGAISDDGKISIPAKVSGVITSEQVSTDAEGNKTYATDESGAYVTGTAEDASYYNLVKCAYTLALKGNDKDKVTFNTYFTVGEHSGVADQYIDNKISDTQWKEAAYNQTNRDGWTGITGTLALRMLGSWNAYLQNSNVSTDLDGDLGAIDTVSGATKTSNVFVQALEQAKKDGFIKGVSENVQVTIDKGDAANAEIDINSNSQDGTTISKNADGTYTVNANHRKYGGGRLSLLNVYVYNLKGQKVGTAGMKELAKGAYYDTGAASGEGAYKYLKTYNTSDTSAMNPDSVLKMVSFGSKAEEPATVPVKTGATIDKVDGTFDYGIGKEDEYISLTYTNDGTSGGNIMPITLTTKKSDVTHVVFRYLLGHATFSMAYDLEEMSKVSATSALLEAAKADDADSVAKARAAYEATPYDVRPFLSGLETLEKAEADLVGAKLGAIAASPSKEDITALRAELQALDPATRAKVSTEAVKKLENAEEAFAKADAAPVSEQVSKLPAAETVKPGDKAAIEAARAAYDALDDAAKAKVDVTSLEKAEKALATAIEQEADLANATVAVSGTGLTYTGSALSPAVTVKSKSGATLKAGTDYTAAYKDNTNAGTASVTVTGKGSYSGSKTATFSIAKASQSISVAAKAKKQVSYKAAKKGKSKGKLSAKKSFKIAGKAKTAVKYALGNAAAKKQKKFVSVSAKGIVTLKKGLKKGTYTVKVSAAADTNYNAAKDVTVKFVVK